MGDPEKKKMDLPFQQSDLPFQSFHIRYEVERKFLGKIYVMVLEGKFPQGRSVSPSEKMELRYSGFFKKGKPFFISVPSKKAENSGSGALNILNEDPPLLDECWKLDVEFLKVFFDFGERVWRV